MAKEHYVNCSATIVLCDATRDFSVVIVKHSSAVSQSHRHGGQDDCEAGGGWHGSTHAHAAVGAPLTLHTLRLKSLVWR